MPTALSTIAMTLEGVGHVLRDRTLAVPPYQRSFAWHAEQVETFWWDLRSAFDAPEPDYFLGTIVLTATPGSRIIVIDGQQRLTTTAILFTAVRDEFLRRGDYERASVIEADYIAARDLRSRELQPRVTLNAEDDDFFRSYVVVHPDERPALDPELPPSNKRLAAAVALLTRNLREHVEASGPAWEDTLFRWIDLLEAQVRVITVQVAHDADAFLIFETLNDRGLDLTITDLLKNYLFALSRDNVEEVQKAWLSAVETILGAADEETYTTFIRHYWSSLHGATRERELYNRLRTHIRTREAAVSFAHALDDVAPLYAGLLDSAHPIWERWPYVGPEVDSILRLGLEQNRPLLLAAMQKFGDTELRALLHALVNWSVRGLIVGGIGGGTTERYYAEAATKISSGRLIDAEGVLDELAPIVATDEEFSRHMAMARVNKTRVARYYLIALARFEQGEAAPALVSYAHEDEWALYLALPRRAEPNEWPEFPEQDLGQWANRLGNQFVLPRSTTVPDAAASEVALWLAAQGRPLPVEAERWNIDIVAERQHELAESAPWVWPRLP